MGFLKQNKENEIVFVVNNETIKDSLVKEILKNINPEYKIGIDMKSVSNINSTLFIKCLNENKFKLYNIKNEVLTCLSIILKDGKLRSYMNYEDFKYDKRELVRRRFSII